MLRKMTSLLPVAYAERGQAVTVPGRFVPRGSAWDGAGSREIALYRRVSRNPGHVSLLTNKLSTACLFVCGNRCKYVFRNDLDESGSTMADYPFQPVSFLFLVGMEQFPVVLQ
jgi:hypothetical protein